jgi:Cu2+-exporting ATPase/Cu+-exporting ATPase
VADVPWWRIVAGGVIAVNAMTFALAVNTSDDPVGDRWILQIATLIATLVITLLLGAPLASGTWAAMRRKQVTVEALFVLSFVGALTASALSMVRGDGPVFWDVAGVTLVVYSVGRAVGRYSQQRVLKSLADWDPQTSRCDRVRADGTTERVTVAQIGSGDRIRVHPGMTIPADGNVVSGRAFVREAAMTGESFAATRSGGDRVFAGTIVLDATLEIEATSSGSERQLDRIATALQALRGRPAPSQVLADRMMQWFVPVLLAVTIGTAVFWTSRAGMGTGLFNAMSVLLVACPCALGFATPLSVWSAIRRLGGLGLLAKNGEAIEKLASADTFVFDKTGTLTIAGAYVPELLMLPGSPVNEAELRAMIACAEARCEHPIATALRELGTDDGSLDCRRIEILPGVGIAAMINNRAVRIGTTGRISDRHTIEVSVDGAAAAIITLDEQVSGGLAASIEELAHTGIRSVLMTGDAAARAARIPIATQHSGVTPDDKLRLCRELAQSGKTVAFVGDGLNDAAAMSACAVGIAVDEGAMLTQEVADVVWTRTDLHALPAAIATCRYVVRSMRMTMWQAIGYNAIGIALAATGMLHPVAASILMTCSSLAVTWRALRLHDCEVPS